MALGLEAPAKPTRFSWILQGISCGPDHVFDEDLACYAEAAILPTRGAMVAEWLLVVPRFQCVSVASLEVADRKRLLRIADDIAAQIRHPTNSTVIFEHGPGNFDSLASCGVDQAHLHVVGGPLSVEALIQQVGELQWNFVDYDDPWATIPKKSDYLLLRDELRAAVALVDCPVSQRLRRAVAVILNRPNEWDYRVYPHVENAKLTKRIFGSERVRAA